MRLIYLLFTTALLSSTSAFAQIHSDKVEIYRLVMDSFIGKNMPLINETFNQIYKYDLDGDFEKWFYDTRREKQTNDSVILVTAICVTPISYYQKLLDYARSFEIILDRELLFSQLDHSRLDSLTNYVSDNRIISWRRAPLKNSWLANLFKKSATIGLSTILFDASASVGFVKLNTYSKDKRQIKNNTTIIMVRKVIGQWIIAGLLQVMKQPIAVLQ